MIIIFFLHIQEWWNIYDLRAYEAWRLPTFLFISLYPINLFILARLLFPLHDHEEVVLDYKSFYFSNYRKFFSIVIVSAILSGIENYVVSGRGYEGIILQVIIIIILTITAWKKTEKEWIHKLIVSAWILTVIIAILVNWNEWLIT